MGRKLSATEGILAAGCCCSEPGRRQKPWGAQLEIPGRGGSGTTCWYLLPSCEFRQLETGCSTLRAE